MNEIFSFLGVKMETNSLLDGKYRIVKQLGRGGTSSVYLAENIKLGSLWAVKETRKDADPGFDLLIEPNLLKKLDHPALSKVFDIVENEASLFLIVDYIEGVSLDKKLEQAGCFDENTVVDWAIQLCDVLAYLHSLKPNPVIYRDMKPSNIMLTEAGRLKLIDFGIAREYKSRSAMDTVFIGTRGYAAPEQYGAGQTNARTDIYGLGATLYHLLTGIGPSNQALFEFKPLREVNQKLSGELERIIGKCVRSEPSDRFQSAAEVLEEFRRLQSRHLYASPSPSPNIVPPGNQVPSRKLIITVWDNAEFGCELAYSAARGTGLKVFLADADALAPKADLILNTEKFSDKYPVNGRYDNSVLEVLMNAVDSGCLSNELLYDASLKKTGCGNLFIATGNYRLENYEYFRDEQLVKLVERAYQCFDLTVLLVNASIYDSFTVIALIKSDYNIAAVHADLAELRKCNATLAFLEEKQHIPAEKTKFVIYEYDSGVNMDIGLLREITWNNLAGTVGLSRRRVRFRSRKTAYARRMEKNIAADYRRIMRYFGIPSSQTPLESLFARICRAFSAKGAVGRGGSDARC